MKDKIILTDCDGVLLNWEKAFEEWMNNQGYFKIDDRDINAYGLHIHYGIPIDEVKYLIKQFNHSSSIGFLEPFRDAKEYVQKLWVDEYKFIVITSLTKNEHSVILRERNLTEHFSVGGLNSPFEQVICLDVGADKHDALLPWQNSELFWIEDKAENAIVGKELGLKSILIEHNHNNHVDGIPILKNWKEIYEHIKSHE